MALGCRRSPCSATWAAAQVGVGPLHGETCVCTAASGAKVQVRGEACTGVSEEPGLAKYCPSPKCDGHAPALGVLGAIIDPSKLLRLLSVIPVASRTPHTLVNSQ